MVDESANGRDGTPRREVVTNPTPRRRRHFEGVEDNDPILNALDRLGNQMSAMDTKFTAQMASMDMKFGALSETYVPRREISESISAIKDRQ